MPTIQSSLQQAYTLLKPLSNPRLDAELLLAHILNLPRSSLHAYPEKSLTPAQQQQFDTLVQRRVSGESIAHLLGEKEFWSLNLRVTKDTLIPRPETELLVELTLAKLAPEPIQHIADLGTGSGAIALAIASERPHWQVTATDNYPATLEVAQHNAKRLQLTPIEFRRGDWCRALPLKKFNAIVSNPPYIAENDPHLTTDSLRHEPKPALVSGKDGLTALTAIINNAAQYLAEGGWLLLEHGYEQGSAVRELMLAAGYLEVVTYQDLSGLERVTAGRVTHANLYHSKD